MVKQIFLLPEVKGCMTISNKLEYTSCLTSWQANEKLGS